MYSVILLKLLAILLMVAIGYGAGRMRWLGDHDPARVLGYAAFYIFVPALLFRTTSHIDFTTLPWGTLAAFFVPIVVLMVVLYAWQRRTPCLPTAGPSVRAITASFGNTVQLGIPMAAAMFGEQGLPIHVAIVSLHALTLLTVLTALVELDLARERARSGDAEAHIGRMLFDTARKTIIHPVVLPILAGLVWNALGAPTPALIDEVLVQFGNAVVPLCLVLIGLSLAQYGLQGALAGAVRLSLWKLVLLPAVVLVVGHWGFGLSGLPLSVVVMAAALPTGNNALIFSQRYHCLEGETTATITVSTFGFALTAPVWLWIVTHL
ncbi:AEC family transporter [Piscinibacter gummiphilus]|uniref:AEC family transporter n=1 Tax=Piscinibacter gummiphilus TaxID=946333 RepID=A0ABZ0CV37_9BURK|nr:AEC family transporter [Piscinibacter gummiphilus]WOB08838.1 AEC family transporter [Piscinibacter gummiphilus]